MEEAADNSDIKVYSDGSHFEGGVGAAALLYRNGEEKDVVRAYLGTEDEHMVFEVELVGEIMAAKLLKREKGWKFMIGLDNQAAIQTTMQEKQISGQYLIDILHEQMRAVEQFQKKRITLMRWVPGHENIQGNERSDQEAKQAAKETQVQ